MLSYSQIGTLQAPPYRTLSVDSNFASALGDSPTRFFDCLVLLPNLKTLEVFSTARDWVLPGGFGQESTRFHSICELAINETTMELVGRCPNVESVTVSGTLPPESAALLGSHGKELKKLKRIAGVHGGAVRSGKLKDILAVAPVR